MERLDKFPMNKIWNYPTHGELFNDTTKYRRLEGWFILWLLDLT